MAPPASVLSQLAGACQTLATRHPTEVITGSSRPTLRTSQTTFSRFSAIQCNNGFIYTKGNLKRYAATHALDVALAVFALLQLRASSAVVAVAAATVADCPDICVGSWLATVKHSARVRHEQARPRDTRMAPLTAPAMPVLQVLDNALAAARRQRQGVAYKSGAFSESIALAIEHTSTTMERKQGAVGIHK